MSAGPDLAVALDGSRSVLAAISVAPAAVRVPSTLPPPPSVPLFDVAAPATRGNLDAVSAELYQATDACDAAWLDVEEKRRAHERAVLAMNDARTRLAKAKQALYDAVIARRPR